MTGSEQDFGLPTSKPVLSISMLRNEVPVSLSKLAVLSPAALVVQAQAAHLAEDRERGDIPGWVLITIMTAGLVTLIWGVANQQLKDILTNALNSVRSP